MTKSKRCVRYCQTTERMSQDWVFATGYISNIIIKSDRENGVGRFKWLNALGPPFPSPSSLEKPLLTLLGNIIWE